MSTAEFNTEEYLNMELLRFTTAGSVDDGKSTLIGRLLYDSKAIFQDQMEQLENTSKLRGEDQVDLALLTDGLRAEREQGITIDVAYRYFSTPKRKFIIADTPGHEQYTRNMVTGASTADLAIILIDARNGVLTQSRRHGFISSLLGIPHLVVAVNKMDVVDWDQDVFNKIVEEYTDFSKKLNIHDITFIPISALTGDNVVNPSENMPWYDGPTVMHQLENVTISADRNLIDFRMPVQYVVRPHQDFRGFAGRISSGVVRKGDEIVALPSLKESTVKDIVFHNEEKEEAFEGESIVLQLEDEIDISRGDMIVKKGNQPEVINSFEATICWMDDAKGLNTKTHYILRHTSNETLTYIKELRYQIDVNTLHRKEDVDTLKLNEIGRLVFETAQPIMMDPYVKNRETGSFVLIDPNTFQTAAAGMIVRSKGKDDSRDIFHKQVSSNVRYENRFIDREMREQRNGYKAQVLWFTGLSASGKSTVAKALEKKLFDEGKHVYLLDGDNIRHGLNGDLGFSEADRTENIRRIGHVARVLFDAGAIVLCTFISPKQEMRDFVRSLLPEGAFKEIFVHCDIEECKKRDPKGLYKKAMAGEIRNFTGIDQDYEVPVKPEVVIDTMKLSVDELVDFLRKRIDE
ncbi:MAG: sulfate adenylyltransferase subunit CysN [Spirochaetales bacterium]|nr:sulfate adenylyltransferase subunit CysN [Spirochaetales bacterium]